MLSIIICVGVIGLEKHDGISFNLDIMSKDKEQEMVKYTETQVTQNIMSGILDWKDNPSQNVLDRDKG